MSVVETHILLSPLSGILLVIAAVFVLLRDPKYRINQYFMVFLAGLGLYQIFDGFMYQALFIDGNNELSNLLRDLSLASLIIGLSFGAIASITIYYGEEYFSSPTRIVPALLGVVVLILGSVFFDSTRLTPERTQTRDVIGWAAMLATFLVLGTLIVLYPIKLLQNVVDPNVQTKIKQLAIGLFLIIFVLFLFDIAFVVTLILTLVANDFIHLVVHLLVLGGAVVCVKVLSEPLQSSSS